MKSQIFTLSHFSKRTKAERSKEIEKPDIVKKPCDKNIANIAFKTLPDFLSASRIFKLFSFTYFSSSVVIFYYVTLF